MTVSILRADREGRSLTRDHAPEIKRAREDFWNQQEILWFGRGGALGGSIANRT